MSIVLSKSLAQAHFNYCLYLTGIGRAAHMGVEGLSQLWVI